jgi:hypothetical protein
MENPDSPLIITVSPWEYFLPGILLIRIMSFFSKRGSFFSERLKNRKNAENHRMQIAVSSISADA